MRLTKIHQFTDGCASQYKGCKAFANISHHQIPITRNFFETSHGKSVCDGLGAVVKNACHRTVLSGRAIINDAHTLFQYCQSKLSRNSQTETFHNGESTVTHSIRNFVHVEKSTVQRNRADVKTLKGTRLLHAIQSTGQPFHLQSRQLSCYCRESCMNADSDVSCPNTAYTGMWMNVSLDQKGTKRILLKIQSLKKNRWWWWYSSSSLS